MLVINIIRYFSELFINKAEEKEKYMQKVLQDAQYDLEQGRPGAALARAWYLRWAAFYVETCIYIGGNLARANTWLHKYLVL